MGNNYSTYRTYNKSINREHYEVGIETIRTRKKVLEKVLRDFPKAHTIHYHYVLDYAIETPGQLMKSFDDIMKRMFYLGIDTGSRGILMIIVDKSSPNRAKYFDLNHNRSECIGKLQKYRYSINGGSGIAHFMLLSDPRSNLEKLDIHFQTIGSLFSLDTFRPLPILHQNLKYDIEFLLNHCNLNIDERDHKGRTCLWYAIHSCRFHNMKSLLQHGANINIPDNKGRTPLHIAIKRDYHSDLINILLKYGPAVNATDNNNHTPFMYAINLSRYDITILLSKYEVRIYTPIDIDRILEESSVYGSFVKREDFLNVIKNLSEFDWTIGI